MYCGCGTAGNRTQWALFLCLSLIGMVLAIVSRTQQNKCRICSIADGSCEDLRGSDWHGLDEATEVIKGCSLRTVSGTFIASMVMFVLATLPLLMMCCSRKPEEDQLASHSDLLRQSVQFYVGQASDITDYHTRSNPQPAQTQGPSARYSALYNAMYN